MGTQKQERGKYADKSGKKGTGYVPGQTAAPRAFPFPKKKEAFAFMNASFFMLSENSDHALTASRRD